MELWQVWLTTDQFIRWGRQEAKVNTYGIESSLSFVRLHSPRLHKAQRSDATRLHW